MNLFVQLMEVSFRRKEVWGERGEEAFRHFTAFQFYYSGALTQWERVMDGKRRLQSASSAVAPEIMRSIILDTAFFFHCGERFFRALESLAACHENGELDGLLKISSPLKENFRSACALFDGFEKLLTGSFMADFGRISGENLWVGKERISLAGELVEAMRDIYTEVYRRVRSAAPVEGAPPFPEDSNRVSSRKEGVKEI
ncbi:MAG: hypothetical protein D6713_02970 [Deltaproteobacteria bacterium]|nr:MAG: hypothetical protein D6713_02970 [Deltaproteobacteria bacterium]